MNTNIEIVKRAAGFVSKAVTERPKLGVIAGSGLGGMSEALAGSSEVPYESIPGFPVPAIKGHDGRLVSGTLDGVQTIFMCGRVHYYEGHEMSDVVFPVALLHALGVDTVILLSAAGGISGSIGPGTVMVVEDHINLMGANPLRSRSDDMRTGGLFVDMTAAYDPALSLIAVSEVEKCGIVCNRGVIAALAGPSYETPAEIRMLKTLGADAVCMSMVPEVIAARYLGMRVLGMAVITNRAAGLSIDGPNHEEVLKTASIITEGLAGALSKIAGGLGV